MTGRFNVSTFIINSLYSINLFDMAASHPSQEDYNHDTISTI